MSSDIPVPVFDIQEQALGRNEYGGFHILCKINRNWLTYVTVAGCS